MPILKLPDFLINKLKAWEIVERPASVVKELLENSFDAGATEVTLELSDWWRSMIRVSDNWTGIDSSDLELVLERYATSKIADEKDLYEIGTYWFRWEALASIAEVSNVSIQTKTRNSNIWYEIWKKEWVFYAKHINLPFTNGSIVSVESLFYNTPVRQKFLKSAQTEYYYCYWLFIDFALIHYDKHLILKKNWTKIFDLKPSQSWLDRVLDVTKKEREKNLNMVEKTWDWISVQWFISDPWLVFGSVEHIKFFINKRPVNDKILKKAILNAYERQIHPWDFPLCYLMIDINPALLDVNVHPRKLEVKFLDPWSVYNFANLAISNVLWNNKTSAIDSVNIISSPNNSFYGPNNQYTAKKNFKTNQTWFNFSMTDHISHRGSFSDIWTTELASVDLWSSDLQNLSSFEVVWQLRNSYIVLQNQNALYMVDQHALAERIAFEKFKVDLRENLKNTQKILTPLSFSFPKSIDWQQKITELEEIWFEVDLLSENSLAVYWVASPIVNYWIDIQKLVDSLLEEPLISLEKMTDYVFAMKACKWAIKAWQKLSPLEMQNLIKEWFTAIPWMFVCQHWRPFFIEIDKGNLEKNFDR